MKQPRRRAGLPGARPWAAFTLIELLVTIGVIAILLAILLPALRGAFAAGGSTVALSNLRGIAQTIEMYTQRERSVYPYHAPGEWYDYGQYIPGPGGSLYTDDPWALRYLWATTMHPIAPWPEHYRAWLNQGVEIPREEEPWDGRHPSYSYACAFFARPEVWSDGAAINNEEGIKRVHTHEVKSMSLKVLMFDARREYLQRDSTPDDPRAVLTADGAATMRNDRVAAEPVQNRVDNRPPQRYLDTPDGVRGRDY
jgi:prepilin-type N-terminal cleavage/methylation domain-containing protein